MHTPPSKDELKTELLRRLSAELEGLERAQKSAIEGATHEEARPENDKDTRALEASYLARGQALRIEELRVGLAEVAAMPVPRWTAERPVAVGALVTVEGDAGEHVYLLAPHGGGVRLAAGAVQVVTPRSPVGRALLGRREGDDGELVVEGRSRSLSIAAVA